MNAEQIARSVDEHWETSILPTLERYIRIPNQSPLFDPDWKRNGHMDRAIALAKEWVEAQQIASRAAGVGFDWENPEQVIEKLHEELAEFDEARRGSSHEKLEDELGDMLFVLVNLARFVKVEEVAALIAFCASADCSFTTGAVFDISGGRATY